MSAATNSRPAEEDVRETVSPHVEIEVYWCYACPERKTGHWYARVIPLNRKTIGRKVESREHGLSWARGIAAVTQAAHEVAS